MRFSALLVKNFHERKAQNARKPSEQDANVNMLHQIVTLATAIFLFSMLSPLQLWLIGCIIRTDDLIHADSWVLGLDLQVGQTYC